MIDRIGPDTLSPTASIYYALRTFKRVPSGAASGRSTTYRLPFRVSSASTNADQSLIRLRTVTEHLGVSPIFVSQTWGALHTGAVFNQISANLSKSLRTRHGPES
jgi:hypothetical protein